MAPIYSALYEYIKINQLFLYLIAFLCVLMLIRTCRISLPFSAKSLMWFAIILGLVLRIAWLGFSSHEPKMKWDGAIQLENDWINIHAVDLTKGIWFHEENGEPSGRRPIGYPIFLGALYQIFGYHPMAAWSAHLALFVVTAWLLFRITSLLFSERAAVWASFFVSIYPTSIYSVKLITDEHLFLPLWYGGLCLLLYEVRYGFRKTSWVWYGLIFGLATITRTNTIFMPVVVGLALVLRKAGWRRAVLHTILVALVMQAVNLPWVIRNYRVWGVPVLYTATAPALYTQVNETATVENGGHIPERGETGFSEEWERAKASKNQGRMHQVANQEMKRWIMAHPTDFLVNGAVRIFSLMQWNRKGGVWPIWYQYWEGSYAPQRPLLGRTRFLVEEAAFAAYYILFHCFLFSLIMLFGQWRTLDHALRVGLIVLAACFIFWLLEHMVIFPHRKYRYPLEPLMMVVAVYFLDYAMSVFSWTRLEWMKKK